MRNDMIRRAAVRRTWAALGVALLMVGGPTALAQPARPVRGGEANTAGDRAADFAAHRMLERARDLLLAGESERGVKMLETIIEQYPASDIRYHAWLALGKHYLQLRQHLQAINYLHNLKAMDKGEEKLTGEGLDLYLESLYLTGVAYFEIRQYGSSFPVLRKITNEYPNTVWANQAYYYIGMCHFAQENWNKAIEALSVVGTFIDADSPTVQYVEAGRRFYAKVGDQDLPVYYQLGKEVKLTVTTAGGDEETFTAIPLTGDGTVFIGSIATVLGSAKKGNGELEVFGGDTINTTYTDANTFDGVANVPRKTQVQVVSSGVLSYTLGDYNSIASAAFIGQPVFVSLFDADLDTDAQPQSTTIRIVSRYKEQDDDGAISGGSIDLDRLFRAEADRWRIRDEVSLKLTELGEGQSIRTGRFVASLPLQADRADLPVDKTDSTLTVAIGDDIVATYLDERHINGTAPREVQQSIRVVSEIDAKPRATQYVVSDPTVRARKNVVEAEAYLELGRIFRSMGLTKGAGEKCDEGLTRVDDIIKSRQPIPSDLREQAFRLKWELYLTKEDYRSAISTCQLFNRLYPESPFVDQALMKIGMIKYEAKLYQEAIGIFNQILHLSKSQVKAEAQFRIAEATEEMIKTSQRGNMDAAIAQYKLTAERYPDSEYAGSALGKLVDYYIGTRDYAQADDLLEQIFQDYPDAQFLDSMLLKWVMVAFRMQNFEKAYDKCSQLVFEYPSSSFAERAKEILPKIEARVRK